MGNGDAGAKKRFEIDTESDLASEFCEGLTGKLGFADVDVGNLYVDLPGPGFVDFGADYLFALADQAPITTRDADDIAQLQGGIVLGIDEWVLVSV